jgi:methyltransferase (TIGR00027 family)
MGLEQARANRLTRSTAEGAALMRAAGALIDDPALRGPDDMAADLIGPGLHAAALIKVPLLRHAVPVVIDRLLPGAIWFEVARTRGMDELLLEEVAAGAEQAIVLGAGLDSRPYRLAGELSEVGVYEVDHPTTAAYKRDRVRAVVGEPPANVRYVTVDFDRDDLAAELAAAGFDPGRRTVVVWSGVAPYLAEDAVSATLDWFAGLAPTSALVFDYCWREMVDGELDHLYGARQLRRRVAAQGEPLRSGIPRGRTAEYLAAHGLELVEDIGLEEATARYLTGSDGRPPGRLWEFGGVVHARVPAAPIR